MSHIQPGQYIQVHWGRSGQRRARVERVNLCSLVVRYWSQQAQCWNPPTLIRRDQVVED